MSASLSETRDDSSCCLREAHWEFVAQLEEPRGPRARSDVSQLRRSSRLSWDFFFFESDGQRSWCE